MTSVVETVQVMGLEDVQNLDTEALLSHQLNTLRS